MTENDTDTDEEQTSAEPAGDEPSVDDPPAVAAEDDTPTAAGEESTEASDGTSSAGQKVVRSLQWAAFAILILVALIATLRFYFAASNAINEFVTRRYRPLFQAIFNLVILLASALGLSVLVRRIA